MLKHGQCGGETREVHIHSVRFVKRAAVAALVATVMILAWTTRGCTRWPETYIGSGPSMEPAVRRGEIFTVMTPVEELRRGALVIFRFQHEDTLHHVLRRVAGLPGDRVAMRGGQAIVNDTPAAWPWRILEPRAARSEMALVSSLYDWGPVIVPPDSVFLLSDTRDIVGWPDSRFIGPVAVADLEGTAGRRIWARPGRIFRRLR
jgi:signal peptidase I